MTPLSDTFGFARHTGRPFAKPKEPFFASATKSISGFIKTIFIDRKTINN